MNESSNMNSCDDKVRGDRSCYLRFDTDTALGEQFRIIMERSEATWPGQRHGVSESGESEEVCDESIWIHHRPRSRNTPSHNLAKTDVMFLHLFSYVMQSFSVVTSST